MDPGCREEYDQDYGRRWKVLRKAAARIAPKLTLTSLGDPADLIAAEMEHIGAISYLHWTGNQIEDGSQAQRGLQAVADASRELQNAIRRLGNGALRVMAIKSVDSELYEKADPEGLPDHAALVLRPEGVDGPWLLRLRALETLAETKAQRIHAVVQKGGRQAFAKHLQGSDQARLIWYCLQLLRKLKGDPKWTLPMAQAIHEAMTGIRVRSQWGRRMFARLSQTPL